MSERGMGMRDLTRYGEVYSEPGFEKYQIKYRRKKVLEILNRYKHRCIFDIGIGPEPLFQFVKDFDEYYFFEPGEKYYIDAIRIATDVGIHGINRPFYVDENIQAIKPDFIICSSLLHEVESPEQLINDITKTAFNKTVIHFNVPNANSFHRVLAKSSGLIDDVKTLGTRNVLLQQNMVFDMELLLKMVESCGLKVIEKGSYFIKPFTHEQMQRMLDERIIDEKILEGLYNLAEQLEDYGSEIYVNAVKRDKGYD